MLRSAKKIRAHYYVCLCKTLLIIEGMKTEWVQTLAVKDHGSNNTATITVQTYGCFVQVVASRIRLEA